MPDTGGPFAPPAEQLPLSALLPETDVRCGNLKKSVYNGGIPCYTEHKDKEVSGGTSLSFFHAAKEGNYGSL